MDGRVLMLAAALLGTVACSQRQTAPLVGDQGMQPSLAGVYQYEAVLNRGTDTGAPSAFASERVSGTIRLEEVEGGYRGEITASGRTSMPIISVMRGRDREVTLLARDSDGGRITLRLNFVGDGFNGAWVSSNGFSAPVRGMRRQ